MSVAHVEGGRAHLGDRRWAAAWSVTALTLAAGVAVALANQPYFDLLDGVVGARDSVARGLLFSSWLVLLSAPFVVWRPSLIHLQLGDVQRSWRLIGGVLVAGGMLTALVLATYGATPYGDASWFIEMVVVPVTEELAFRGALLGVMLLVLRRVYPAGTAATLAIVFNGLAFGMGHVANATALSIGFVIAQMTFAGFLGMACAWLVIRTRSVYPAMLLHAVVNGVVVAI